MTARTPVTPVLTWCLHLLLAGLLGLAALRAGLGHAPDAGTVVALCVVMAVLYAAGPLLPPVGRSDAATVTWLAGLAVVWLFLLAVTADAVWLAFPLFLLQLHLLPGRTGLVAVVATCFAAIAGFASHQPRFTIASAIGPALGAAVATAVVWGYRALHQQSEERQQLIEQLTATRADLATAQHAAGVTAERERLAREIHDTLAQGLSSIQLLLTAAVRALPPDAGVAARHVEQARQAAADDLAEARRFVAALSPPALDGTTLGGALERLCATVAARHRIAARFHTTGQPAPMPTAHEVALLRIAQSALTNSVRHAHARTVDLTLSYLGDEVALDIVDDGTGFDPDTVPPSDPATGGFGLAAIRARTRALGGTFTVESGPGNGTALAVQLPLISTEGTAPETHHGAHP
ncbi:MAG: sensor histidine kinase [Micromonosporaceae bacterium]